MNRRAVIVFAEGCLAFGIGCDGVCASRGPDSSAEHFLWVFGIGD